MRVYLLNDTSAGHAGMRAVMASLRGRLAGHEIVGVHRVGDMVTAIPPKAEVVVCNGEGTLHHDAPAGRVLLETLSRAQDRGLQTHLVNAVFQQTATYYSAVLRRLTSMTVREPLSLACARANGAEATLCADACADPVLYSVSLDPVHRTQVMVGAWPFWPSLRVEGPWLPVTLYTGSFLAILNRLRRATVYLTGQHHGVYAAALSETPFVPIPSNSWKIEGLLQWFRHDTGETIPLARTAAEVRAGITLAQQHAGLFTRFARWLHTKPVWTGLTEGVTV